jgi:3'-phosphoadenosine 5'-phosphosulfate sulfotransferase (PAPS reductase)/FAD synthetase
MGQVILKTESVTADGFYNKRLRIPPEIFRAVRGGYAIALSTSGGKDSQAMMIAVVRWLRNIGAKNYVFAIHSDLGRAEWEDSLPHCQALCEWLDIPLIVVKPTIDGKEADLIDLWERREKKLAGTGKPFWSSAKNRYCTSDGKVRPINTHLRKFDKVISVEGIRWQESKARAAKPCVSTRKEIATCGRLALTWNAIIDWTTEDVWQVGEQSSETLAQARKVYAETGEVPTWWSFHPAYAKGNTRVSCALCVLACKADFTNGITHNPELAGYLSEMEQRSGFTMRQGKSIRQLLQEEKMKNTLFAA